LCVGGWCVWVVVFFVVVVGGGGPL
jgi:hypothetical protein